MDLAVELAEQASHAGEVPVGAVVTNSDGEILASAFNRVETDFDPTAHAEILVIRAAARKLGGPRLVDCSLYVTLEPCAMCAQAIANARIGKLFYGASDPKGGAVDHGVRLFEQPTCHHKPEIVGGIRSDECTQKLKRFFNERR